MITKQFSSICFRILKWLSAISEFSSGLSPVKNTNEACMYCTKYVCANHFVSSDYVNVERRRLNRHTFPSVFDVRTAVSPLPIVPECVVQQPVTHLTTTLSPASPHVLPVQRVYSKLPQVDNVSDENSVVKLLIHLKKHFVALT